MKNGYQCILYEKQYDYLPGILLGQWWQTSSRLYGYIIEYRIDLDVDKDRCAKTKEDKLDLV